MANEYLFHLLLVPFYYPIQYANQYVMNHNKNYVTSLFLQFSLFTDCFSLRKFFIICTNFKTALQYDMYFYYCWTRKILKSIARNGSAQLLYSVWICKSSADTTTKTFSKKASAKILVFSLAQPLEKKRATHSVRSLYAYFQAGQTHKKTKTTV